MWDGFQPPHKSKLAIWICLVKKYTIRCRNITPASAEVNHDDVINGWTDLENILKSYDMKIDSKRVINISIDSSEIREKLYWLKPENCDQFFSKLSMENMDWTNNHPFSSNLHISLTKKFNDENWSDIKFIERLLEQMFLVLNIAVRGGCNYGDIEIGNSWRALHCADIESAWHFSSINNWPLIEPISIKQTWDWFEKYSRFDFVVADTSITKASAVLLHLSYKGDIESTDVLQLSQVIENIYLVKGEPKARGLNRKIPVVLGALSDSNKKLIQDFYTIRSDIAHGDFPLFRPRYGETDNGFKAVEDHYWKISREIDKGVAIVVATLQFLIKNDASSLSFIETISVEASG